MVLADLSEEGNQETAQLARGLGTEALAVRCDVTQSREVKAAPPLPVVVQLLG